MKANILCVCVLRSSLLFIGKSIWFMSSSANRKKWKGSGSNRFEIHSCSTCINHRAPHGGGVGHRSAGSLSRPRPCSGGAWAPLWGASPPTRHRCFGDASCCGVHTLLRVLRRGHPSLGQGWRAASLAARGHGVLTSRPFSPTRGLGSHALPGAVGLQGLNSFFS